MSTVAWGSESTPSDSCGFDGRWDTSRLVASTNRSSMSNLRKSSLHRPSHPGHSWNTHQKRHLRNSSQRHSLRSCPRRNHSNWSSERVKSFSGISCSSGEELGNHCLEERRHCSLRSRLGVLNNSRTGSLRSKPGGTSDRPAANAEPTMEAAMAGARRRTVPGRG